jgi:hypothetical protein
VATRLIKIQMPQTVIPGEAERRPGIQKVFEFRFLPASGGCVSNFVLCRARALGSQQKGKFDYGF